MQTIINNNKVYVAIKNPDGTYSYIPVQNRTNNIRNYKKQNYICDKQYCCNYIYRAPQSNIIPYTPFLLTFIYTSPERFPIDLFVNYIPIDSTQNYIKYVYSIEPELPVKNDLVTLTIHFKFTDNEITTDGLYFKPTSKNFWNLSTSNLTIIKFGNIPLSRNGSQFSNLNSITFNAPDTPSININTTLDNCFSGCINFNSYIGNWDTSNVINMSYMFYNNIIFNQNISSWNTSKVSDMSYMFYNNQNFNQDIRFWNTNNVINMSYMFYNNLVFNKPLTFWNTSNVTDMSFMFNYATNFNQNIDNFNVSSVIFIRYMFSHATSFNNGDTSNIASKPLKFIFNPILASFENLFENAIAFNQNISYDNINEYWDTQYISEMNSMFSGATLFNNGGYALNWNTNLVTNMNNMFAGASNFNNGDTTNIATKPLNFNTIRVENMAFMFYNASKFNQNLASFNTSKVVFIESMFNGATLFNNGDTTDAKSKPLNFLLNQNLTSLSNMFQNATSFNQSVTYNNIADYWNTTYITSMSFMFYNATIFNNGDVPGGTSEPMDWIVTQFGSPPTTPLNFSVLSALTISIVPPAKNSPFFTDGSPDIPNLNYTTFGQVWTKISSSPTANNWSDISTNIDGNYILLIAYTPAPNWSTPGFYVSSDKGAAWDSIGGYTDNSVFVVFSNTKFYSCSMSSSGQYQAVMTLPDDEIANNYIFLSNTYGASWIKQTLPVISSGNDISSLAMSGTGEYIICGNIGIGTSSYVTIGSNFGTVWIFNTITTTILSSIYSVAISLTGNYMAAHLYSSSTGENRIAISSNFGNSWNITLSFNKNLGLPTDNSYGAFKKMLSMSSTGQYILIAFADSSYVSSDYGTTWTLITTTLGVFSAMTTTGQYMLATTNIIGKIGYNKNFGTNVPLPGWVTTFPTTALGQNPTGLCTSYYGQYSYLILNNTNTDVNGVYFSVIPLIP